MPVDQLCTFTSQPTIGHSSFALLGFVLAVCVTTPVWGSEPVAAGRPGSVVITDRADAPRPAPLRDPTRAKQVSLDELLSFADVNSPGLAVVRSTRSLADAERVAASPLLPANPQLAMGIGPRYGISGIGVDADVSLSQRLYVAGERGRRRAAAKRFADRTDAEIEQARWAVHCDVHAAFHRTLIMRERSSLAERVLAFQEDLLRVVQGQVKAGNVAPLMQRLAHAEVAQAKQALIAAQQAYLVARIQLAQMAGWPVAHPPEPRGALDSPQDPPLFESLTQAAKTHLPVLRTREAAVREAEARIAVARREVWPQPYLGVQYRHEGNPTSEGPYNVVLGTLAFSIPSFQTNQGERALANARASVARAEQGATLALLDGQIAQAHSEVVAAAQRVRSYGSEILPRFEENLGLLRRSFELGEIDMLSLLIGRERFLKIQSDAFDTYLDYFVALANLERAVGIELWTDRHVEGE